MIPRLVRILTRPRWLVTRFTRFHAAVLRLAGGRIRRSFTFAAGQPVLALTTTGRKSGEERSTAVAYFRDGENYVITGANLGNERDPAWSLNLEARPSARIEVGGRAFEVRAQRATGSDAERLWKSWVELVPPAEGFRTIAGREIPVWVLSESNAS